MNKTEDQNLLLRAYLSDLQLEGDLLLEIEKHSRIVKKQKDDELMFYGAPITDIPIILNGAIKVMRENEDGKEILLYYIESGDTCAMTLNCCMHQAKSEVRAVVEEDSILLFIPVQKMDEWLAKFFSWRKFVLTSMNNRFNEMLQAFDMLAFKQLDERLWNYLNEKKKVSRSNSLELMHFQIAEELNTSRVVVSRLLKQLENDGKVKLHRNKIEMIDM